MSRGSFGRDERVLDAGAWLSSYPEMAEDSESPPKKPVPRTAAELRREREAAALRANLRKRKEQQRAWEDAARDKAGTPDGETPKGIS